MAQLTLPEDKVFGSMATVLSWRQRVGAKLTKGAVVLYVEIEQGVVEVESPIDGVLTRQLVEPGQQVSAKTALAELDGKVQPAPAKPSGGTGPGASAQGGSSGQSTAGSSGGASRASRTGASVAGGSVQSTTEQRKPGMAQAASPAGNVTPILMPQAGQSMEEGVLVKWHVQPGAMIKQGEVIFEIETDKATMDVEATDSGRLARIVVQEGGFSPVLQPVAYLADNDADVDAYLAQQGGGAPAAAGGEPSAETASVQSTGSSAAAIPASQGASGRVKASPAARKIAHERGVNLAEVAGGSGPQGRILSTDVPVAPSTRSAVAPATRTQPQPAAATSASVASPVSVGEVPAGAVRKRLSSMRKAIARNLSLSKSTIPHWYLGARIDAGPMLSFYKSQKAKYPCSVNDVIVMACARAMVEFPMFRSRFDGDAILEFPTANVGVAVGMDDGLVVPVVVGAETYTLEKLGVETRRLANQARAGKIENMGLGTFTISNLGMFGVDEFTAIVNPPEAAILAVGAAQDDVIVKDGAMKLGKVMKVTLSSDHRLIDGTLGAQFMARLKALLENPLGLLS